MARKPARSDEVDVFAPRLDPINPSITTPPSSKDGNLSEYQRLYGAVAHGGEEIRVPQGESLYTALDRRGLLEHAAAPSNIGMNLVQEGELGLAMFNGRPRFLAPGRHTLWSPLSTVISIVPITQKLIELGPVQIVTVNQGELGLSRRNGETVLLDPGRYILRAPHRFERSTAANSQYIELGTYRRITVPAGFVAIAFDKGKQIVIRPEDTTDGFETNSPTFSFDPRTGFQPIQLQVRELEQLTVNTRDGVAITCKGLITYLIHDPRVAFMAVQDVHGAVKRGAEATLTSLFLNASIDEIAPSVPTHPLEAKVDDGKGKEKKKLPELIEPLGGERADFSRHVRESFLHDFSQKVHAWGIELKDMTVEKLEFDQNVKDLLRKRAQARLETATNLANMYQQTEVAMQQADRQRREIQIKAEAEAASTRLKADAEYYAAERRAAAAKLLSDVPLSAQLELKRLDVEMVRATGDKTTFIPINLAIGDIAMAGAMGQTMFAKQRSTAVAPSGVVQGN